MEIMRYNVVKRYQRAKLCRRGGEDSNEHLECKSVSQAIDPSYDNGGRGGLSKSQTGKSTGNSVETNDWSCL